MAYEEEKARTGEFRYARVRGGSVHEQRVLSNFVLGVFSSHQAKQTKPSRNVGCQRSRVVVAQRGEASRFRLRCLHAGLHRGLRREFCWLELPRVPLLATGCRKWAVWAR